MHGEPKSKGDLIKLESELIDEASARAMLETIRWGDSGPRCIFEDCGGAEVYRIEVKGKTYVKADGTERHVPARHLYKCKACKRQFSVTKGTIFEDSKIPLTTWIRIMYRMCSSKKGISAVQIHREYGIAYEAAWFLLHRIRWAMTNKDFSPFSGVIEADETYVGGKPRGNMTYRSQSMNMSQRIKAAWEKKTPVFGMLERGGRVRAVAAPNKLSKKAVQAALVANIDLANSQLMTDEHAYYQGIEQHLPHGVIRHKSEYVRGEVHTQGIESFWAGLKRQLVSTHHHVDAGYLNMYVQEHAYRHNTREISDRERFLNLLGQVDGRLDWYVGENAKGE